jgi:diacylglycerol kinase family enzyme
VRHDPTTATYVTVIQNPASGTGGMRRDRLVRLLGDEGFSVTYAATDTDGWEHVLDDPGDLVLVAGGDGTVGHVAERLVGRGVPLAILPLGTANNIARSLGLTDSPEAVMAGLRRAGRRRLDAGIVRGPWGARHFLEGVGLGLFARTMCLVDKRAEAGRIEPAEGEAALSRDLRYLARVLERLRPQHWHIEADGNDRSGEYLLCEVMNIRSVGPNLELAPEADSGDGRLDLVLARPEDRHQLQAYIAARIAGREPAALALPVERVQRVRIVAGGEEVQVDDEIERPSKDPGAVGAMIDIGVVPGAIEVLTEARRPGG